MKRLRSTYDRLHNKLSSDEVVSKRIEHKTYHHARYGTIGMDTIHGRLFELKVYVNSLKFHTLMYFCFVLVSLMLWPIAVFLALPISALAGKDRDLHVCKLILVLSSCLGYVLWCVPLVSVLMGGGFAHFFAQIMVHKQLTFLDFCDMFLSEFMILLTIVFSFVFHEITTDVAKYKEASKRSWRRRTAEHGLYVEFEPQQAERFRALIAENYGSEESGERPFSPRSQHTTSSFVENGGAMFIEEVINLLELLPGWESEMEGDLKEGKQISKGLFSELSELSDEADAKNLWPIDIWLVGHQYYCREGETPMTVQHGVSVALRTASKLLRSIMDHLLNFKYRLVVLVVLNLIRCCLPRFWLKYMQGGVLWPEDPFSSSGIVVLYSSIVTFSVGFCWMGLFYCILCDYRHNLVQMVGLSALADPYKRVEYSQNYLMSSFWFGMGTEECEKVLSRMPLLDLCKSSNVSAFWRLREYTTLDCSNERMAISILLEIVIIWMTLKFLTTVAIMLVSSSLPAILIVTVFDLFVFGGMIIVALETALKMNSMLDEHKKIFVQGKYMTSQAIQRLRSSAKDDPKHDAKMEDYKMARKMLEQYLDMTNEYDERDQILFGMTVTGGKIISSGVTLGFSILTLLKSMISSGQINAPVAVKDQIVNNLAVGAWTHAVHLLSNYMGSFYEKVHMA